VEGQKGTDSARTRARKREEVAQRGGGGGRAGLAFAGNEERGRGEGGGSKKAKENDMRALTVGVVCGGGCGVVSRRSGVGIVTPVVAGVADHPGHPGAPRRRL